MLELPPPAECGLPEKFKEWRPQQLVLIENSLHSDKRFVAQCVPTGSGKSLSAMGQIVMNDERALYLTATKGLQDQISGDFASIGVADIRGKNAYRCVRNPDAFSCEEGQYIQCQAAKEGKCPHTNATKAALNARIVVTNYTCYITNYIGGKQPWGKFDFLALDEGHQAADELSGCLGMEFDSREVIDILRARYPKEQPGAWVEFAAHYSRILNGDIESMIERFRRVPPSTHDVKRLMIMKRLLTKLERVVELVTDADWIVEATRMGYRLDAIWSAPYAERYLFRGIKRVLITSATLTPKSCDLLGIADDELDFQDFPSTFSPVNNRVYVVPTVKVDNRMDASSERLWLARIDSAIRSRLDRKGIIHPVSFERARRIASQSEFTRDMIVPEQGMTQAAVARFKNADAPAVLIAPGIETGYDFAYDLCRYQIIAKIPFPDTRSLITKARCDADPEYHTHLTLQKFIQMVGRGCRAPDDWCENIVTDSHALWFLFKRDNQRQMPLWFRKLLKKTEIIPAPRSIRPASRSTSVSIPA